MDLLKIVALSFGSVIFLFILTKLMRNKEMSQLSIFEWANFERKFKLYW